MSPLAARSASSRTGGGRDSWYGRSDADYDWVPKCIGCLPESVTPHNCSGLAPARGNYSGMCYCDVQECIDRTAVAREQQKQRHLARLRQSREMYSRRPNHEVIAELRQEIERLES